MSHHFAGQAHPRWGWDQKVEKFIGDNAWMQPGSVQLYQEEGAHVGCAKVGQERVRMQVTPKAFSRLPGASRQPGQA